LLGRLNKAVIAIEDSPVSSDSLKELLQMIVKGDVSNRAAKDVFDVMFEKGGDAGAVVDQLGLRQIQDKGEIERLAKELIDTSPEQSSAYKAGKTRLIGWFVGQIMQQTKGKANPKEAEEILKKLLEA
jgi:aspartyl-tRNA(Asn)/glutamyl-tRNA(Gln) amidotransferase subunit B